MDNLPAAENLVKLMQTLELPSIAAHEMVKVSLLEAAMLPADATSPSTLSHSTDADRVAELALQESKQVR